MSQLSQFLTPPQLQLQPYPEPPGYTQIRQMLADQLFRRNADPYGMNPYGSMQSNPLNPFGGQGLFNPYTGQREQGGQTSSVPPWLMGGMSGMGGGMGGFGGGGGGGGLQELLNMLMGGGTGGPAQAMGGGISRGGPQTVPMRQPIGQAPTSGGGFDGTRYDGRGAPPGLDGDYNRHAFTPGSASYDAAGPVAVGGGGGYYQYGSTPGTGNFYSWGSNPAVSQAQSAQAASTAPPPGMPQYDNTSGGGGGGPQTTGSFSTGDLHDPRLSQTDQNFIQWMLKGGQGWYNPSGGSTPFKHVVPFGGGQQPLPFGGSFPQGPALAGGRGGTNVSPFQSSGSPVDPNNPNPGDPNANHHFDGQLTNPQPYPDENSPMPYDGESLIDKALAHLKQIFGMGGAPSEAPKQVPPTPTPTVVKKTDIYLPEHKGAGVQAQQEEADRIVNEDKYDGSCHDGTEYGAVRMGMRPGIMSQTPGVAPHLHAPMSMAPSAQHIGMPKNPMAGLNRILGGMPSATRRGQIASYRVGRPNAVFDGEDYDAINPADPNARMDPNAIGSRTLGNQTQPQTQQASNPAPGSLNSTSPYPTGGQTLGAPMYPWLMPYTGQRTAPMSPFQQQGLGGASQWMLGNMGLNPAFQYNQDLLGGKYIGSGSPYMQQIQQGAQTLKDQQDKLALQRIASGMAAGGNALSGARMNANQQYQNASDAAFQQQMGQMNLQDLQQERALQNQGVGQLMGLSNQLMGGYGQLMNMGAVPQQTQQNDLNAQYSDWLRQIGSMQQGDQFQQQMANQVLHAGYPGVSYPQYGTSGAAGLAALLGGTGALGQNGWLSSLLSGLGSGVSSLFGGNTGTDLGSNYNFGGGGTGNIENFNSYAGPYSSSYYGSNGPDWLTQYLNSQPEYAAGP